MRKGKWNSHFRFPLLNLFHVKRFCRKVLAARLGNLSVSRETGRLKRMFHVKRLPGVTRADNKAQGQRSLGMPTQGLSWCKELPSWVA
jgi:hypothetical protein